MDSDRFEDSDKEEMEQEKLDGTPVYDAPGTSKPGATSGHKRKIVRAHRRLSKATDVAQTLDTPPDASKEDTQSSTTPQVDVETEPSTTVDQSVESTPIESSHDMMDTEEWPRTETCFQVTRAAFQESYSTLSRFGSYRDKLLRQSSGDTGTSTEDEECRSPAPRRRRVVPKEIDASAKPGTSGTQDGASSRHRGDEHEATDSSGTHSIEKIDGSKKAKENVDSDNTSSVSSDSWDYSKAEHQELIDLISEMRNFQLILDTPPEIPDSDSPQIDTSISSPIDVPNKAKSTLVRSYSEEDTREFNPLMRRWTEIVNVGREPTESELAGSSLQPTVTPPTQTRYEDVLQRLWASVQNTDDQERRKEIARVLRENRIVRQAFELWKKLLTQKKPTTEEQDKPS